jgi:hypothetical protein
VFEAIQKEQFYIITPPQWLEVVQLRTDRLLRMENPQSAALIVNRILNVNA